MGRFFRRNPDHYYLSSEEFQHTIDSVVDLDQLVDSFCVKLREAFGARTIYLVLYEPITNRYVGRAGRGLYHEVISEFNFARSDNLIRWLSVNKTPLRLTKQPEVVKYLTPQEQELLAKVRITLVLPLVVVNRLTGALFFSTRENGSEFTDRETDRLVFYANQGARALEYALSSRYQEERLKRLFHADKLATIGELAAGVAHEIRNPLTSIRSAIQYLQKELTEERKALAHGVLAEVDRINEIVKALLSFSRTSELQMNAVSPHALLDQTIVLLESELRKHDIIVRKQYGSSEIILWADQSQLKQLFLNIFLNGIQAMSSGGTLTISTGEDEPVKFVRGEQAYAWIKIEDTGCGIPASDLPRVFDPFFTTKESGTGLGLSISYGIVSRHGGEIEIQSRVEGVARGTAVLIRLPKNVHAPHPIGSSIVGGDH